MKFVLRALSALVLSASFAPTVAHAGYLQCVPFARQMSGIDIRGNAKTWWAQAAGRFERGNTPREGSVLTLPGFGKMYNGHVAMVSKVVNDREVLLTHANWSRRGGIERNVRAIDVSEKGDWSRVKIWFGGIGDFGKTTYPAYGFIYAGKAKDAVVQLATAVVNAPRQGFKLGADIIQMAALER